MPSISDRTIALGNLNIHYRQVGEQDLPPLIVLHGLGGRAEEWDHVLLALADRYHVVALDQRGHGESSWPGNYSFEFMRDDLAAFADALALHRFSLIGHSMGAPWPTSSPKSGRTVSSGWSVRTRRRRLSPTLPVSTPGLVTTMGKSSRRDHCPSTSRSGQPSSPSCADLIQPGGVSYPRSRPQS